MTPPATARELHEQARESYRQLRQVDWTFAGANTRDQTHGIHPYPAKFIPQISRSLIEILHPKDGTAVFDPFCGSGTALLEAARLGIPAIGVDLSPLACLISRVKVTPLSEGLDAAVKRVFRRASGYRGAQRSIPALDHWFKTEIQESLSGLLAGIDAERDEKVKDALRVALSAIVVRVSNQESDTRYAAVDKSVTAEEVRHYFERSANSLDRALRDTWAKGGVKPDVAVIHKDILTVRAKEIRRPISLVITSPPYPNAYEYWLYHKYRMYWLGMDPIAVREREIGARPNYFKRNPQTADDFGKQMGVVFELLSNVMVPFGHACFQVGNSIIHGKAIDNAEILMAAAEPHGFRLVERMARKIPLQRKAFNLSHARIRKEALLVFQMERT